MSSVCSVEWVRSDGGIEPERVLDEALKLARLTRVVNESDRIVR
jgi:hypothetical protein